MTDRSTGIGRRPSAPIVSQDLHRERASRRQRLHGLQLCAFPAARGGLENNIPAITNRSLPRSPQTPLCVKANLSIGRVAAASTPYETLIYGFHTLTCFIPSKSESLEAMLSRAAYLIVITCIASLDKRGRDSPPARASARNECGRETRCRFGMENISASSDRSIFRDDRRFLFNECMEVF